MASFLMSATLALGLALPSIATAGPAGEGRALAIRGPVELSPAHAIRAAEGALRSAVLERYAEGWNAARGFWVPEARYERLLSRTLQRYLTSCSGVTASPVEAIETSVGTGYRQSYELALDARATQRLRDVGFRVARALNEEFAVRWGAMGGIWVALFLLGFGLDRATRGWITGRIAIGATSLGALATWLLLP